MFDPRQLERADLVDASPDLVHTQLGRSFLTGPHADKSIVAVRWFKDEQRHLVGRVWFGPGAQGPPGHAHGGSLAAVLDEALGSACWVAGYGVVAAELTTRFLRMVPLESYYDVRARVDHVDGRKVYPVGEIVDAHGNICASASGVFVVVPLEKFSTSEKSC